MNNSEVFNKIFTAVIKYFKWIILVVVAFILCSGIRIIQSDEVGIILRMGRVVGETRSEQVKQPGLLFALPYIIDQVKTVPVGKTHEIEVKTHYTSGRIGNDITQTGYVLTGDNNVLLIDAIVKYKITDPVAYALYNNDVNASINGIVSGVMTKKVNYEDVDGLLTDKKNAFAQEVLSEAQQILDKIELGVTLSNLECKSIAPPNEVKSSFDEVNTAFVDKETKIKEANQYQEKALPTASADADKLISDAKVKQQELLTKANDAVAEFNGLIEEYNKNPEVVYQRIYRDKVSKILSKMGTKIVIPQNGGTPQIFLP